MIVKTVTRPIVDATAFGAMRQQPDADFIRANIDLVEFEKQFCDLTIKIVGTNIVKTMFFTSDTAYNNYTAALSSMDAAVAVLEANFIGILGAKSETVEVQ